MVRAPRAPQHRPLLLALPGPANVRAAARRPRAPTGSASNAGEARIWGFEAELLAEPVAGLRIEGSLGYINYNLYDNQGNPLLLEGDECGGQRCYSSRTPKFDGALGVQYSFTSAMGSFIPRLDVQHQSKIYFHHQQPGRTGRLTLLTGG